MGRRRRWAARMEVGVGVGVEVEVGVWVGGTEMGVEEVVLDGLWFFWKRVS